MTFTISARYQKDDDYGKHIFITNPVREKEGYKILQKLHKFLDSKFGGDVFLPVFCNTDLSYGTVRCSKSTLMGCVKPRDTVKITFKIKQFKNKQDKTCIICELTGLQVTKKYVPVEMEDVECDLSMLDMNDFD